MVAHPSHHEAGVGGLPLPTRKGGHGRRGRGRKWVPAAPAPEFRVAGADSEALAARLTEVEEELEAMDASGAEARAEAILEGLQFTMVMRRATPSDLVRLGFGPLRSHKWL